MDEERTGIELIVSVVAWFLVVLAAFFVGAVVGIIAILVGTCLFGSWFVRLIRGSDEASAGEGTTGDDAPRMTSARPIPGTLPRTPVPLSAPGMT